MWCGHRICVVVPAFNESTLIGVTLRGLPELVDEVVVIDDGSADDTAARARDAGGTRTRVLVHAQNQGVGAAIRTGYWEALRGHAELVVVMAADNQMDPHDLPRLLAGITDSEADYAKGNRFLHPQIDRMPALRRVGSRFLSWLTRRTTGLDVDDCQCGYTAISRTMLQQLPLDDLWVGYGYPNDLLALLARRGARVVDVPVRPVYVNESSGLHAGHVVSISSRILRRGWELATKT